MELADKIKWSFLIFNILQCLSSGCEYVYNDCYYDAYCFDSNFNSNDYDFRLQDSECSDKSVYTENRYRYSPLRIKIEYEYIVKLFLQKTSTGNFYSDIIVSLEITNTTLATTPDFNRMYNLAKLNLSNNYLHVANLYNQVELNALEDIDLSHNSINSIQVDNDQFVYKNLRALNLSYNLLVTIPGGVFEPFKNLETLDLSYNNIIGLDSYTFEGSKNLKYLYLSSNNISDINGSLFRFSYLEELYLDNNNIENLSTREFTSLESLRTLSLNFNKISDIQKDTFSNTKSLVTLKLHHNLISHISKDSFLRTNSLTYIDLSDNLIQNLPQNLFVNKTITSFSITGNVLRGAISKGMFEGLQLITELDITYQAITAIEELAFYGLAKLTTLLLNHNKIRIISEHSFKSLICLKQLDLSNNMIMSMNFIKRDLVSLEIFSLSNNLIKQILREDLQGLNRLRLLDLSNNNITNIESNSFNNTETVESLQLFNNPINGTLLSKSFVGLHLIPVLDLSYTLLTSIQNESFSGMANLQDINISRSFISKLEYRAFENTGIIKSIDLSFNKLTEFFVNGNDLKNLTILYLNNNAIVQISNYVFKHMTMLTQIILSHNSIKTIDDECFADQADLLYLDVSFNNNLTFRTLIINNTRSLETLILSGVKNITYFTYIGTIPLRKLELTHLDICNVSTLHLNSMTHLTKLIMSNNNIPKIESDALKNMRSLDWLDLSFNNLTFIQPSTFKDNIFLRNLNLSHNLLTSLNYGTFRGLVNLNLLDISYNNIYDLGRERFYDTPKLKVLIADYNRITDIDSEFFGIHLDLLSIGHNLLSCEEVVSLKEYGFKVSAINIDESHGDNIDGITCNMNHHNKIIDVRTHLIKSNTTVDERILLDIRDILLNSSQNGGSKTSLDNNHIDILKNIYNKFDKYGVNQTSQLNDIKSEIVQLKDIKSEVASEVNMTNLFLERILKVILGFGSLQNKLVRDTFFNATSNNDNLTNVQNNPSIENHTKLDILVSDVNQLKQEVLYIENVISDIDRKISLGRTLYQPSKIDNLNKSDHNIVNNNDANKSFIFMEVCVSLILLMLICFFLYKFYETKIFHHTRFLSTRNITDVMENSNL